MEQPFESHHQMQDGLPAGGSSYARGIDVHWQDGPLGRGADRIEPNGAFVETVIAIAKDRLHWYQGDGTYEGRDGTTFACAENAEAIGHLDAALASLNDRTARRENAGTEGTHQES